MAQTIYWVFFLVFLTLPALDTGAFAEAVVGAAGVVTGISQWVLRTRTAKRIPRTAVASDLASSALSGGKSESGCGFQAIER
jgi:hypothetical protein